jgi:hypothetical protein
VRRTVKIGRTTFAGERDAFLVGDDRSWVAGAGGPEVTEKLVSLLGAGITWKGQASVRNPLTQNARGKHALICGQAAHKIVELMAGVKMRPEDWPHSKIPKACSGRCGCP